MESADQVVAEVRHDRLVSGPDITVSHTEIGRASCRERVSSPV